MRERKNFFGPVEKALYDYQLIENGDKILIGASGGKDSTALIEFFSQLKKRPSLQFEYKALHIKSDFAPPFPEKIKAVFEKWDVPFEVREINTLERVKDGFKMNCWWCSTQRRRELLLYAVENGYNKIALGHHLDDVLETFLMNMTNKGELSTMIPKLKLEKYPVEIIRPLYYLPENELIEHAKNSEYAGFTCTCNYQNNSTRKEAKSLINIITAGNDNTKELMLKALKNVNHDYLP